MDDKERKIVDLFARGSKESERATKISAGRDVNLTVDNSRTTIINKVVNQRPRQQNDGDLTPAHKQRLKELVDAIVNNTGQNHQVVWKKFHHKFRVNSYAALTEEQYPAALKWCKQWYASSKR